MVNAMFVNLLPKSYQTIQALFKNQVQSPTRSPQRQGGTVTPERQTVKKQYPNYKVIVLNDDFNTFEHVSQTLQKYIPGMTETRAWELTVQVDAEGLAIAWIGPQEQAELYHAQLKDAQLTMAPIEPA
jgi:ATP-dependent Clp protease adaptor protein ClpS